VAPRKHLVLDEDIHEALSDRREMTGLPISQIGNAILRAHIGSTSLEQLLRERLIESGQITAEEYEQVLEDVERRLREEYRPGAAPIERVAPGQFIAGSWEIVNLLECPTGAFQLLEVWARDALQHPMTQHAHEADEYIISLAGRCLVAIGGIPFTMTKGCVLQIPSGAPHSSTPMDSECHLLVIVAPAAPEYGKEISRKTGGHAQSGPRREDQDGRRR